MNDPFPHHSPSLPRLPPRLGEWEPVAPFRESSRARLVIARAARPGDFVLKVLAESAGDDAGRGERELSRFREEARLGRLATGELPPDAPDFDALSPEGIVPTLDAGEIGPWRYLAMPRMERDLARLVQERGPLEPEAAFAVLRDCARGLARLESLGVVHRDVKPANILLDASGRAALADFGVATRRGDPDPHARPGKSVGTPAFMSLEQALGRPDLDARADIYSLACSIHYALTGSLPYEGEDEAETLVRAFAAESPPDPRERAPRTPDRLAAILRRAMAREREARQADVAELIAELDEAARSAGLDPTARPGDLRIVPTSSPPESVR